MKHSFLITLLIPLLALVSAPAARADASVAVTVGAPGFYGTVVIGDHFPPPMLVYPQPIIIEHAHQYGRPLYLHVPPGHAKNWGKHCRHYGACAAPVYFIQNSWYNDVYVPTYHQHHGVPTYYQHHGNRGKGNKGNGKHGPKH